MNVGLLNPFEQDFPSSIEDCLDDGFISICQFNHKGTLLAAGCTDGRVVVIDFDTRGTARTLFGHSHPILSLSWSWNGRYLLTGSMDWKCILWDLLSGTACNTVFFESSVIRAQMHPRLNNRFVASLVNQSPQIIDLAFPVTSEKYRVPLLIPEFLEATNDDKNNVLEGPIWSTATYGTDSFFIYVGTSKGNLLVFNAETYKIVHRIKVTSSMIRYIEFSRNGRSMILTASDRIIRLYNIPESIPSESGSPLYTVQEPTLLYKFQDMINKLQWSTGRFSPDGEFVVSGTAKDHNIYIWNAKLGTLVKILEGPKESLEDVMWHPTRPVFASVSSFGVIYVWAKSVEENWSAFAPGFKELEENIEYKEKEDEFDKVPDDVLNKRKKNSEDKVLVDILADPESAIELSSDEDLDMNAGEFNLSAFQSDMKSVQGKRGDLLYLPVRPEDFALIDNLQSSSPVAVRSQAKLSSGSGGPKRKAKKNLSKKASKKRDK